IIMSSKPDEPGTPAEVWETVQEARTKMIFDEDGDTFQGTYEGTELITDPNNGEVYEYINVRDDSGEPFTTSASYQLKQAMTKIPVGSYVKLIRTGSVAAKKGTMLNFKVMVRK
ncbi:MAG TPA: hypothetical protein VIY48_00765, partial [Candidatus Paceibacterota bacterium]